MILRQEYIILLVISTAIIALEDDCTH